MMNLVGAEDEMSYFKRFPALEVIDDYVTLGSATYAWDRPPDCGQPVYFPLEEHRKKVIFLFLDFILILNFRN